MKKAYPDYVFEDTPNCPICGGDGVFAETVESDVVIQLFECTNCGTAYHNPRMSRESLEKYYASGQYYTEMLGKDDIERKEAASIKRAEFFQQMMNGRLKRYLDVGCGRGLTVRDFSQITGCESVGYDLFEREDAVVPIVTDREEVKGKFDIITCLHLMEHLYDPLEMLTWIKSKLSDKGMLYLEIPLRREPIVPHPILFTLRSIVDLLDRLELKGIAYSFRGEVASVFAHKGLRWNETEFLDLLSDKTLNSERITNEYRGT
jgi:SAM-dependent methyltransferase